MEQTIIDQGQSHSELAFDSYIREYLGETAKWTRFLSILGFIGIGLMLLLGLFAGAFLSSMSETAGVAMPGMFSFVYLVLAILYFFPVLFLFRFSLNTLRALNTDSQDNLIVAFRNLKWHYKYVGIATIVVMSIYILLIIIAVTAAAAA